MLPTMLLFYLTTYRYRAEPSQSQINPSKFTTPQSDSRRLNPTHESIFQCASTFAVWNPPNHLKPIKKGVLSIRSVHPSIGKQTNKQTKNVKKRINTQPNPAHNKSLHRRNIPPTKQILFGLARRTVREGDCAKAATLFDGELLASVVERVAGICICFEDQG